MKPICGTFRQPHLHSIVRGRPFIPGRRNDEQRSCWLRFTPPLHKPVYRGCFTLIYAYGLRISEAIKLPISAVDSKQMVLRVIGKGNKQRILPLTESILQMLREVWKVHRSKRWSATEKPICRMVPTKNVSRWFRVSAGRISQLRRELEQSWQTFHGEPAAV